MKTCTKCGEKKPFTDFARDSRRTDGVTSSCKKCKCEATRAWAIANPEKISKARIATALWQARNPETVMVYSAKHYASNREKRKIQNTLCRAVNANNLKAKMKKATSNAEWYTKNADRLRNTRAAWRAKNQASCRLYCQNYIARRRASGGVLSNGLSKKLFMLQRGLCACCGEPLGSDYHLDHIFPLALGGANTDDNIQLLRAKCNRQKGARHPVEFFQARGFLL